MSFFFLKCTFEIELPQPLLAGARNEGVVVVHAPEPIPRATHLDLVFSSVATAVYGSGKSQSTMRRVMFTAPYRIDLPPEPFPAGSHRYPFVLQLPPWLPPAISGGGFGIANVFDVRLDVDWALDPHVTRNAEVHLPPVQGERRPLVLRSPPAFHKDLVLELTLESAVLAQGEPLVGAVAVRSGLDAKLDAVELDFGGAVSVYLGGGDVRPLGGVQRIRIPADALRSGAAVPFRLPPPPHALPTLRNQYIDHDPHLVVRLDVPWSFDKTFEVPLEVLPLGSTLRAGGAAPVVGQERVRRTAAAMAAATGLRVGTAPTLIEGEVGPVQLRVVDALRDGVLGINVDCTFPDVELGTHFRRRNAFQGFAEAPLLPRGFDDYLLSVDRDDDSARPFFEAVLGGLARASEVRLSDHHLGFYLPVGNDDAVRMTTLAVEAKRRAESIGAAIADLPFRVESARIAWEHAAREQGAALVPTGPTLHGLSLRARVRSGEERWMRYSIRTVWLRDAPHLRVDCDLRGAPAPEPRAVPMSPEVALRFPHVEVQAERATLDGAEWTSDPRALLPAVEAFFDWVLATRGEHRTDAPYR